MNGTSMNGASGGTLSGAQNAVRNDARATAQARQNLNSAITAMRGQRQTVDKDRAAVRQDMKSGNTAQLKQDLSQLRTAQQALRTDRQQVGRDERTLRRDDHQLNAARRTLHRDERAAWLGANRGASGTSGASGASGTSGSGTTSSLSGTMGTPMP